MSVQHEVAVPKLHGRLYEVRRELEDMRALAGALAEALDAEVDLRHRRRTDYDEVAGHTGHVLHEARQRRLL